MGIQDQQGQIPLAPEEQARMRRLAEDVNRQLLEMAETVARVLKLPTEGELEVKRIEIVPENATSIAEGRCVHFMVDGECGAYCDPPGICMMCP